MGDSVSGSGLVGSGPAARRPIRAIQQDFHVSLDVSNFAGEFCNRLGESTNSIGQLCILAHV